MAPRKQAARPAKTTAKAPARKTTAAARTKPRRRAAPAGPETVSTALERELKAIARLDKDLANSTLAASARVLAAEMDKTDASATTKLTCARELRETVTRLRELIPEHPDTDQVDELADARAQRLAGRTTA